MPVADDLGNLILRLNPYTKKDIPYSDPLRTVGDMDPYCSNPAPGSSGNINQIEVEADGPYRQDWTFKGEPQRVGMAYRVKYRFPIIQKGATPAQDIVLYWLEDYVLIGFEGAMGG